jgi:AcrR family transcriptional regulator
MMSNENRPYRMTKRAEAEAATRRRITESAVELHGTLGPARTTISALAEHAGVRRATVYRHFPDEAALFAACSAHWRAQNPYPALAEWAAIEDVDARLARALSDLYGHYRRHERMMSNLLRDEGVLPVLAQTLAGYRRYLAAAQDTLMAGRTASGSTQRRVGAVLGHALAFPTWRSLALDQGLEDPEIVHLMDRLVAVAEESSAP